MLCGVEEYVKSGRDQIVIDPDRTKFTPHEKKRITNELHSSVITWREIRKRWLGKIFRKDAFIHSHLLTGFPVEGENP